MEGRYLQQGENVLITGATGCGKSYLACALGHQACFQGYKTTYLGMNRLIEKITLSKLDGTYIKLLNHLERQTPVSYTHLDVYKRQVPTQQTHDFANCINAMLRFYTGVPATILCDNLKTAVKHPNRYEPVFTDLCYQLSEHYQTTFSATRPYSPRDKAMVEKAVSIVYAHIYACLLYTSRCV